MALKDLLTEARAYVSNLSGNVEALEKEVVAAAERVEGEVEAAAHADIAAALVEAKAAIAKLEALV